MTEEEKCSLAIKISSIPTLSLALRQCAEDVLLKAMKGECCEDRDNSSTATQVKN